MLGKQTDKLGSGHIIDCDSSYASQLTDIFNEVILNATALYEYQPRTVAQVQAWLEQKARENYPVIGLVDDDNHLLGMGTFGSFRDRPAYKYSIEHSIYIHKDHQGKGLGKRLLSEIIRIATEQQYHCLIGGIDAENTASIRLHELFGFAYCGQVRQAGYKFGRWLDLTFYQLLLATPDTPEEG